ncbi:hypothetical protein L1987_21857 [Smallanthus sonchifolius]|uniref:Uncharacterized protein n=1 Tax=Smallanthus sonchifolius TaxID=185202 RepID=A0ACB9IDE5_9ASTR|nr:hypothetical protein L1987_21857 [Smallanthus sonchifolius]
MKVCFLVVQSTNHSWMEKSVGEGQCGNWAWESSTSISVEDIKFLLFGWMASDLLCKGMVPCIVLVTGLFFVPESPRWLLYIVSFSAGMGAIPWVIMSEVFPINIKGAAGSLATLVNWFGAWAI